MLAKRGMVCSLPAIFYGGRTSPKAGECSHSAQRYKVGSQSAAFCKSLTHACLAMAAPLEVVRYAYDERLTLACVAMPDRRLAGERRERWLFLNHVRACRTPPPSTLTRTNWFPAIRCLMRTTPPFRLARLVCLPGGACSLRRDVVGRRPPAPRPCEPGHLHPPPEARLHRPRARDGGRIRAIDRRIGKQPRFHRSGPRARVHTHPRRQRRASGPHARPVRSGAPVPRRAQRAAPSIVGGALRARSARARARSARPHHTDAIPLTCAVRSQQLEAEREANEANGELDLVLEDEID